MYDLRKLNLVGTTKAVPVTQDDKFTTFDVRDLLKLDPSDPIFQLIASQRSKQLQYVNPLDGYTIVRRYALSLEAEDDVAKMLVDKLSCKDVGFIDGNRYLWVVANKNNYNKFYIPSEPDIRNGSEKIEVKTFDITKDFRSEMFVDCEYYVFHKFFDYGEKLTDYEIWDKVYRGYFHGADSVVVVPVKDGKVVSEDYGYDWFNKDTDHRIIRTDKGYNIYIDVEPLVEAYEYFD